MAKRRSRKGTNKIQYVPTDRFVKVSLDGLAVAGKQVFVAWRNDIHNGLPEDAYIIVPQSLSKHIVLSLKDNGCGWIEANLLKERTVEFKMRFNVSPYYPDEKETKGVLVRFQLFEPKNQEPILEAELDVFLQCNKSMNKALKGSFDAISSSLSASNATAPVKEEFLYDNFRSSCDGTTITITPAPIAFKFDQPMNESIHSKRKHDFGEEPIGKKLRTEADNFTFLPNEQTLQTELKNPLRLSVSMDISRWLEPIQDLSFEQTRVNMSFLEASCQLPYSCSMPEL